MRLIAMTVLVCALGLGAAGCMTYLEPIVVEGRVVDGRMVAPEPGPYDLQRPAQPLRGEPGKYVVYRQRTAIDWRKVGIVTLEVLEVLAAIGEGAGRCLAHCGSALARCH